jgi:aspartate aminotransferase
MQLSTIAKRLEPSATLRMNELIATRHVGGERILHMGFGESPFPVRHLIRKALCENADQKSYLPTQGILPLRERKAAFYKAFFNLSYSPNQIIVGPGSKTLIFDALVSLVGPLFLPVPSWVSYQHQARLLGRGAVNHPDVPRLVTGCDVQATDFNRWKLAEV